MTITENLAALGSWEIDLLPTIPRETLDALAFFGHVAIVHGRVDPVAYGDSLLAPGVARYVGVLRENSLADDARTNAPNDNIKISGVGMAFWLGDEDNKGAVIENSTTFATGSLFPNVIRGLLPSSGSVTEGTLYPVPGTYSGTHQWQTPAQAIQYVCTTMSTPGVPVNWRVNNNGTLDAGPESALFVTNPQCAIVARGDGEDMTLRGIPGSMNLDSDMKDFTTRVVLLAEGDGTSIATGSATLDLGSNPYRDLHGNPVDQTRMVSESDTTATNADVRAQLALAQYAGPNQDLQLGIQDYDVEGAFAVGDYIYAYDPDKALVDTSQEIVFRGQRLNPIKLQVVGIQWPVTADYTVAYRAADGTWVDLTNYIEITDAGTYVTVGDFSRSLTGGSTEPIGSRPSSDSSVPGVPTLVEPFTGAAYLDARGFTRARVVLSWSAPLNLDGSTILDGDHYDIRYAIDTDSIYPATWSQVSQVRWEDMQSWAQPFAAPDTGWQTMVVGWDQGVAQLQDLSPGVGYDVQIRAVDSSGNVGDWSGTTTFVATEDNIPPSTPAAPAVAASRIAVQVTHTLGKASGGVFNLERDLDHFEVHAAHDGSFTPGLGTMLGKLPANGGMIQGQIPAVGTYQVESTDSLYVKVVAVDQAGNRSGGSGSAQSTVLLIDDAHISDLTVSKVTAGTISASWVMAGEIKTADTGARVRLSSTGLELYDAAGDRTLFGEAATGNVTITGEVNSGLTGNRVVVNPANAGLPTIRFFANSGTDFGFINGSSSGTDVNLGLNSSQYANGTDTLTTRLFLTNNNSFGGQLQTVDASTQTAKGGQVVTAAANAALYYQYGDTFGGQIVAQSDLLQMGYQIGSTGEQYFTLDNTGHTSHAGRWYNYSTQGSNVGIFAGSVNGTSGASSLGITWGPTTASPLYPAWMPRDDIAHSSYMISTPTTTGAEFDISPAANGGWAVHFWAFRM